VISEGEHVNGQTYGSSVEWYFMGNPDIVRPLYTIELDFLMVVW